MSQDFDLLGDPIPENWGRRGRPQHIPTVENRNKIRLLLAFDRPDGYIAAALRITVPTLRKHYFRELRERDEAKPALEASHLMMVYRAAAAGNVGAMKELGRLIDRDTLAHLSETVRERGEAKAPKLGKKEQRREAASQVGGKYAPPAPPRLIN